MATTLANISIKDNSSWNTYLNLIYPIGSVYISYTSTSPATRFGGTWAAITGRFPYFNAGTKTDGSNTHSHTYGVGGYDCFNAITMLGAFNGEKSNWVYMSASDNVDNRVFNNGLQGQTSSRTLTYYQAKTKTTKDSSMPAYQTLYAWRRTN